MRTLPSTLPVGAPEPRAHPPEMLHPDPMRPPASRDLLLYGANGYTGELIAREAVRQGLRPILAGRSRRPVEALAGALGLPWRIFPVTEAGAALDGVRVVLNCAGPFSVTAAPMVRACLDAGAHYLDITGELRVFQACHALHAQARAAGVIVCPGVGFDIVPTDCLALRLKQRLPDAQRIDLAFHFATRPSGGTARTAVEGLDLGGLVRQGHVLRRVPAGFRIRRIPFRDRPRWCVSLPWADVYTAGLSTGVPDGMVLVAMPLAAGVLMRLTSPLSPLMATGPLQRLLKGLATRLFPGGPGETERASRTTEFWGEALATDGRRAAAWLSAPSAYVLTRDAALAIARHCLGARGQAGFFTASMLMGSGFVETLPGVRLAEDGSP